MSNVVLKTEQEYIRKTLDDYSFIAKDFSEFYEEIVEMEEDTTWEHGIPAKELRVESMIGPVEALAVSNRNGFPYDTTVDTAESKMPLILVYEGKKDLLRYCSRLSLLETAKINGASLGKMSPEDLAKVLKIAFPYANGDALIMKRRGKITALHSDRTYNIMPITEMLKKIHNTLVFQFNDVEFVEGQNTHSLTSALWEIPDLANELELNFASIFKDGIFGNMSDLVACVYFQSSDTGWSKAVIRPCFKTPAGRHFFLSPGAEIKHEYSRGKSAMDRFDECIDNVFTLFEASAKSMEKLMKIEIWNPVNCVVSLCNKYGIPKKYGSAAYENVEMAAQNVACMSAFDIYLALVNCIPTLKTDQQRRSVTSLEENVAKVLNADWKEHDVPGVVSWGTRNT